MSKKFIALAGNLGFDTNALVQALHERYSCHPFPMGLDDNPYFPDFCVDKTGYAFHLMIYLLSQRMKQHLKASNQDGVAIQACTVYEDAVIAEVLHKQGYMSLKDHASYRELFELVAETLPPPDLLVYFKLSAETLAEQVREGRFGFGQVDVDKGLAQLALGLYEEWIDEFTLCPVLVIPADNLDLDRDLEQVVAQIKEKLDL